jgi:hypothetical protein
VSLRYFGAWAWSLSGCLCTGRDSCRVSWAGVWLAIDGFAYVMLSLTSVLLPPYYKNVYVISQAALLGEVAFMLWLVIKGARPPALEAAALSSAAA